MGVCPTKAFAIVTGSVPVRLEKRKRSIVPLKHILMG